LFEPDPHWYDRLPPDPALARLEGEDLELWPDISYGERLGLGWSLLVSDRQDEIRDRARDVPGFRWSAVGLLDPEVDRALGDDAPTFGVILSAVDDLVEGEEGRREDLAFEDIRLPVVVRRGEYEDHHGIGHGRVACWATSRGGARAGWLTARHVAPVSASTLRSLIWESQVAGRGGHSPHPCRVGPSRWT
jgi:hypothetical protein